MTNPTWQEHERAQAIPGSLDTPREEARLPSHVNEVIAAKMTRWANRMRGRYGAPVYLCGSALREDNPDPRDWDFRITLPDEDFARRFGPAIEWDSEGKTGDWGRTRFRWSDQCVKDTKDAWAWIHVNADVQIYPQSYVDTYHADSPRVRVDSFPESPSVPSPEKQDETTDWKYAAEQTAGRIAEMERDWLNMLRETAKLATALGDPDEWHEADDSTLTAEFDPWDVIRQAVARLTPTVQS
jgi:hypothetical protein